MENYKVVKTYSLNKSVVDELDSQCQRYGLNASEYIRMLVCFVHDNPDLIKLDPLRHCFTKDC